MSFSLVVVLLLLVSGSVASDLDPDADGVDEMEFALVSLRLASKKFFKYCF